MKFSLVLATLGRTKELSRFLESLALQEYPEVELIIVDQNPDDRLKLVLQPYVTKMEILHLRSEKGLSRARNVALPYITGDIVAFPDDDCWYPPHLLHDVADKFFQCSDCDGVTGCSVDENKRLSSAGWSDVAGLFSWRHVWNKAISFSIFLRCKTVEQVGVFDDELGVGSGTRYGSGEETDYLIRALKAGCKILYEPSIRVGHPDPILSYDEATTLRGFMYGMGMGRVLRKHDFPLGDVLYFWMRPMGGAVISLLTGRVRKAVYHWQVLRGRVLGWLLIE